MPILCASRVYFDHFKILCVDVIVSCQLCMHVCMIYGMWIKYYTCHIELYVCQVVTWRGACLVCKICYASHGMPTMYVMDCVHVKVLMHLVYGTRYD